MEPLSWSYWSPGLANNLVVWRRKKNRQIIWTKWTKHLRCSHLRKCKFHWYQSLFYMWFAGFETWNLYFVQLVHPKTIFSHLTRWYLPMQKVSVLHAEVLRINLWNLYHHPNTMEVNGISFVMPPCYFWNSKATSPATKSVPFTLDNTHTSPSKVPLKVTTVLRVCSETQVEIHRKV